MFQRSLLSISGVLWTLWILLLLLHVCQGKRRWDYKLIFLEPYTTDQSKMEFTAKIQRLPKGKFAFGGVVDFKYDVDETTIVEARAFRSYTGNDDDYKEMPWRIPKQTFKEFLDNFYDDLVVKNFANCSNLPPQPLDPWPRLRLEYDQCQPDLDKLPELAPQGFYKVRFSVTGEVDWGFETTTRVFDKLV